MPWDSVPWFVGGGAQHSPEVARLLAYAGTAGGEGIVHPVDLQVLPLTTPGGSVRVQPGAALVLNRATGGSRQTYVGRLPTEDTVAIAATGSGSGRTDLVVARVEDPWLAGEPWADPTDPTVGPYIFTRVISNVPSTTTTVTELNLGYSAIPLARVTLPVSTSAVTSAMITDLRQVAVPRTDRLVAPKTVGTTQALTSSSTVLWPSEASWTVAVPSWAGKAIIRIDATAVIHATANVDGWLRAFLVGTEAGATRYDETWGGSTSRKQYTVVGEVGVWAAIRGTNQSIQLRGSRAAGTGSLTADANTRVFLDVQWVASASML